jgi:hypothetical protein
VNDTEHIGCEEDTRTCTPKTIDWEPTVTADSIYSTVGALCSTSGKASMDARRTDRGLGYGLFLVPFSSCRLV